MVAEPVIGDGPLVVPLFNAGLASALVGWAVMVLAPGLSTIAKSAMPASLMSMSLHCRRFCRALGL